jgi:uncharacterized protein YjiS (DUF1127 family)
MRSWKFLEIPRNSGVLQRIPATKWRIVKRSVPRFGAERRQEGAHAMEIAVRSFVSALPDFAGLRPGTLAAAIGRRIMVWDARYRERCRMAGLSDEILRDIGTSRGDMQAEARRFLRRG